MAVRDNSSGAFPVINEVVMFPEDYQEQDSIPEDEVLFELYKAAVEGSKEMMEEIIFQHGIDINLIFTSSMKFVTRKHTSWSSLHIAASLGYVRLVRFLLAEGCDGEAVTRDGDTALHIAAKHGMFDVVSVLLEHNVFLRDRQNNQGATALLKAVLNTQHAVRENYRRCVDLLLAAGCNPNIYSSSKVTALHIAVERADLYLVQQLIKSKANVNALCDLKTTPLMRALMAKMVNMSIITELVLAGADTSLRKHERTLLHIAVSRCDEEVIEAFLKSGADPNCQDMSGRTPLWIAVEENNIKIVPILAQGGGNINFIQEPQCLSLLCQAIKNNSLRMVRLLLELGASTYTETFMWSTPLHFAVDQQNIDIIKELLRANCALNTASNAKYSLRPMTPIQMAMEQGNVEIICLLLQAGCKVHRSWLKEDRISLALASKPDVVNHIRLFISEVPSLMNLSCWSLREYLKDRFRLTVRTLTETGVIPYKLAAFISLADVLE